MKEKIKRIMKDIKRNELTRKIVNKCKVKKTPVTKDLASFLVIE